MRVQIKSSVPVRVPTKCSCQPRISGFLEPEAGCCARNPVSKLVPFSQLEPDALSVWEVSAPLTLVFPDGGEFTLEPGGTWEERNAEGILIAFSNEEEPDGLFRSPTDKTVGQFLGRLSEEEQARLGVKYVRTE